MSNAFQNSLPSPLQNFFAVNIVKQENKLISFLIYFREKETVLYFILKCTIIIPIIIPQTISA